MANELSERIAECVLSLQTIAQSLQRYEMPRCAQQLNNVCAELANISSELTLQQNKLKAYELERAIKVLDNGLRYAEFDE